eukprot:3227336-Prymnesium_polylepis.1
MAVRLCGAFGRRADSITLIDEPLALELRDARVRIQHIVLALLDCFDSRQLAQVMESDTSVLETAILHDCDEVVTSPRIQHLIHNSWLIIRPSRVCDFADRYWMHSKVTEDVTEHVTEIYF